MSVAILHHCGDANLPPVRVPHTLALAAQHPDAMVLLGAAGPEWAALVGVLPGRVATSYITATDTLTEVVRTRTLPRLFKADTLLVSTEPGHVGRAALIARIVYWRRGVKVIASPSAPGTYRSPLRRTAIDAVRAVIYRLTGRVVMW